jgi:hypothetical protein
MAHLGLPPHVSGVRVSRSLVLCVVFCRSSFVLLSYFVWPLCCLFLFYLRILITSLCYLQTLLTSLCLYLSFKLVYLSLDAMKLCQQLVLKIVYAAQCNFSPYNGQVNIRSNWAIVKSRSYRGTWMQNKTPALYYIVFWISFFQVHTRYILKIVEVDINV